MPSLEGLLNFCEYFQMSIGEFFEENFRYPVQYEKIIKELNKMDALTIEKVYEFIQLINR